MLSWQYALTIAGCLLVVTVASRIARTALARGDDPPGSPRSRGGAVPPAPPRPWGGGVAWEAALLFGLYGLWQFAGSFTVMSAGGALPRARWLWHAERVLHMPSETSVQRLFLPHPLLVQAFNLYYDILHFPVLGACLIWL